MAEITASLVKELRERTGAGMMECKKALVEANGDIELAIDNMRKSGQAENIFYLTAKTITRTVAEDTIKLLKKQAVLQLKVLSLLVYKMVSVY